MTVRSCSMSSTTAVFSSITSPLDAYIRLLHLLYHSKNEKTRQNNDRSRKFYNIHAGQLTFLGRSKNRSPRNMISRTYFCKKYVLNKLRLLNRFSVYFIAPSVIRFRRSLSIGSEQYNKLSSITLFFGGKPLLIYATTS